MNECASVDVDNCPWIRRALDEHSQALYYYVLRCRRRDVGQRNYINHAKCVHAHAVIRRLTKTFASAVVCECDAAASTRISTYACMHLLVRLACVRRAIISLARMGCNSGFHYGHDAECGALPPKRNADTPTRTHTHRHNLDLIC